MGVKNEIEDEGRNRMTIGLLGVENEFIEQVSIVQNRTVRVLVNGGPVDISAAVANPNVVAILEAFYGKPLQICCLESTTQSVVFPTQFTRRRL
jgi:hypothetical protein